MLYIYIYNVCIIYSTFWGKSIIQQVSAFYPSLLFHYITFRVTGRSIIAEYGRRLCDTDARVSRSPRALCKHWDGGGYLGSALDVLWHLLFLLPEHLPWFVRDQVSNQEPSASSAPCTIKVQIHKQFPFCVIHIAQALGPCGKLVGQLIKVMFLKSQMHHVASKGKCQGKNKRLKEHIRDWVKLFDRKDLTFLDF